MVMWGGYQGPGPKTILPPKMDYKEILAQIRIKHAVISQMFKGPM